MISWTDINSLNKQKLDLQIKLTELQNSNEKTPEKINELRSEILYLDKQIQRIIGTNELKRQKELNEKKSGVEQRNIKGFYAFKDKYKKISKMKIATTRMIAVIENLQKELLMEQQVEQEVVKVKR